MVLVRGEMSGRGNVQGKSPTLVLAGLNKRTRYISRTVGENVRRQRFFRLKLTDTLYVGRTAALLSTHLCSRILNKELSCRSMSLEPCQQLHNCTNNYSLLRLVIGASMPYITSY